MKRVLFVIMLVCSVFVFPGWSYAEYYLSGYLGGAFPHSSDAEDNTGVGGTGEMSFDAGVATGAKLGYWFSEQDAPYFGLELDLNGHFPDTESLSASGLVAVVEADVTAFSLTSNALLRYPEGALRPYAGLGIGYFYGKIGDGTIAILGVPTPFRSVDDSAFTWQILGGVDWLINPNVSVFVEYKYSLANLKFGGDVGIDLDYRVSQTYVGVSYRF